MTNQTGNLSSCGVGMEPEGRNERKDCIDCGCFEPCAPQAGEPSPAQGVKPLDWRKPTKRDLEEGGRDCALLIAPGLGGEYAIQADGKNFILWRVSDPYAFDTFPTVDAAKAYAEADWQEKIGRKLTAPAQPDAGEEHGSFSQEAKIPTEQASLVSTLVDALKEARAALHYHYLEWDGEPEDAIPLQQARAECDRALAKATGAA